MCQSSSRVEELQSAAFVTSTAQQSNDYLQRLPSLCLLPNLHQHNLPILPNRATPEYLKQAHACPMNSYHVITQTAIEITLQTVASRDNETRNETNALSTVRSSDGVENNTNTTREHETRNPKEGVEYIRLRDGRVVKREICATFTLLSGIVCMTAGRRLDKVNGQGRNLGEKTIPSKKLMLFCMQ